MCKISVIIPCFGVEQYLDRCMNSLVHQSLKEIEFILVDDCSLDATPAICDEWEKRDERVKVIHKLTNEGLGLARNTGLNIATGEYVMFVDSDDFVSSEMCSSLYSYGCEYDLDAVYCGFYNYKDGHIIGSRIEAETNSVFVGMDVRECVLKGMLMSKSKNRITDYEMSVWHAIYKRDLISNYSLLFVSERIYISEDIIFHIDFLSKSDKIGFVASSYYYYCQNPQSLTTVLKNDRFQKECALFDAILLRIKNNNLGWDDSEISNFFALKVRFAITSIVNHINQLGVKTVYNIIYNYSKNKYIKKYIYPNVHQYPLRYNLFFYLLRNRLVICLIMFMWFAKIKK